MHLRQVIKAYKSIHLCSKINLLLKLGLGHLPQMDSKGSAKFGSYWLLYSISMFHDHDRYGGKIEFLTNSNLSKFSTS